MFVLVQGLSAPLVGALIAKKGARFSMALGAAVMLLAMLALIFLVSSPVAYFLVFGIVTSAATMMVGQLAVQSTIGDWFVARRGVAMTAMMVLGASASFVGPPVVNAIVGATGGTWRSGWYLLVGLSAALIPVALLLVKNKPADLGQHPDGVADPSVLGGSGKGFKVYKNTDAVPFKRVARTPAFWLISLAATGGFASYTLATSQSALHFSSLGFDSGLVVAGVAVMGGVSLAGAAAQNEAMLFAFYVCVGFGFGGVNAVFPPAMANYFGASSFSKNLGTGIMITTVVASALPLGAEPCSMRRGTCTIAFYLTAGIVAACAACGLFVRIPRCDTETEAAVEAVCAVKDAHPRSGGRARGERRHAGGAAHSAIRSIRRRRGIRRAEPLGVLP